MAVLPDLTTSYANLLVVTRCPSGIYCEVCGALRARHRKHIVRPVVVPDGVFCLTLCTRCVELPAYVAIPARPPNRPRVLAKLIAEHSAHLDIAVSINSRITREELQL